MSIVNLNKDNFESLITSNPLVFVEFWAKWCGPCQSFAKIYEEVAAKYPECVFARVDIGIESELAHDFNVKTIPLLMVFKKRLIVFSESGTATLNDLCELVEKAKNLDVSQIYQEILEAEKK